MDRRTSLRPNHATHSGDEERQKSEQIWEKETIYDGWNGCCGDLLSHPWLDERDSWLFCDRSRVGAFPMSETVE